MDREPGTQTATRPHRGVTLRVDEERSSDTCSSAHELGSLTQSETNAVQFCSREVPKQRPIYRDRK